MPDALEAVKPLRSAQNLIARAKQELSEQRARIKLKPPDRKDAAAELGRQEIRAWLRSMPQAKRDRMFNGGGEQVDPAIADAVLSAPRVLSGVAASHLKLMQDRLLEAQFPGELDDLADLENAIAVTERAATVNMNEIIREMGITQERFAELAQPVLREVDAADAAAMRSRRSQTNTRTVDVNAVAEQPV
jgi:hypothetical protein